MILQRSESVFIPKLVLFLIIFNPCLTIALFKPTNGTTSHTVAKETISKKFIILGSTILFFSKKFTSLSFLFKPTKKTKATPVEQKPLFQKIQENIPIIQIRRNSRGNFEHKDTGLVFDSTDKCVVGKQEGESIAQLTKEDIETCDRYHFTYRIPENLGSTKITEEDNEMLDKKLLEEFEN